MAQFTNQECPFFPGYLTIRVDAKTGNYTERRKYAGTEFDSSTGLSYMQARYQNGSIGRFISEDPVFLGDPKEQNLTNPQSLNSYSYANGNPICNKDADGRNATTLVEGLATGLIVAGATAAFIASAPVTVPATVVSAVAYIGLAGIGYGTYSNYEAYSSGAISKDEFDYNAGALLGGLVLPGKVGKTADASRGSHSVYGGTDEASAGSIIELHRPYVRESVRQTVWDKAPKAADGRPIDPNTLLPIRGTPDIGHVYGKEFWRLKQDAQKSGLTQKQFNDKMNDPKLYQLEDAGSNRSHQYEKKL